MNGYATGKPWKIEKERHILEAAFQLSSQRGIEAVTVPEIAEASGVGRATVFRYFTTKLELVVAVGTWKWEEYIETYKATLPLERIERMTGAEWLQFFLDSFLNLYRNHPDILRFNYSFNSYLSYAAATASQKQLYTHMVEELEQQFHALYVRGTQDGTLRTDITEEVMFSSSFHIMLAAVTRYAMGLVYVPEQGTNPEQELIMLKQLLLCKFTTFLLAQREEIQKKYSDGQAFPGAMVAFNPPEADFSSIVHQ